MTHQAAVITCSDRASQGLYADESGPIIAEGLRDAGFAVGEVLIIPDDRDTIRDSIAALVAAGVRVVITTGGTGVSARDVTVDATRDLLDYELPGIPEAIRAASPTPKAMLTRGTAGIVTRDGNRAVVINAPGSKGGAKDTITTVAPVLDHIVGQLDGATH